MRPIEEQTILVTGSTDGLGRETALELLRRGANVLLHGRDHEKVERVRDGLAEVVGRGRPRAYVADLASLEEVRRLAEEVARDGDRLDALVNNAGVGGVDRQESEDGHELHMAVNHLASFLLTMRLLPLLRRSAPARVVNVSSAAQSRIDFDDLSLERGYQPLDAYARSKLAQVLFTLELAERLEQDEVTVNALHPASLMDTNMVRENFGRAMTGVAEGVEATVRLAVSPDLEGVTGRYFDGTTESAPTPRPTTRTRAAACGISASGWCPPPREHAPAQLPAPAPSVRPRSISAATPDGSATASNPITAAPAMKAVRSLP